MKVTEFNDKVKSRLWIYLKEIFYKERSLDINLIQNLNYKVESNQQRILISYKTTGYFINTKKNIGVTWVKEIFKIVKVFSDLGYVIDLVDVNEIKILDKLKSNKYDIVFGFGEVFYEITNNQPDALSILYMTENHPAFSFTEEKKRLDYYFMRHKKRGKFLRSGQFYKLHHLEKKYSSVISLGEIDLLKSQYDCPHSIFPTGLYNPCFNFKTKNHKETRNNFLWLGSSGAIHKGLDLLIDVFSKRDDITLHICGLSSKEKFFLGVPDRKNIIEYGYMDIKSQDFLSLVDLCTYSILPSCSEGFATSITTGMMHGLIPVVMKNTGFNRIRDLAIFIDDYKLETIELKLNEIIKFSDQELQNTSTQVYEFAHENFNISTFEKKFKKIILKILASDD